MSAKPTRPILIVCLLLGIYLCATLGCILPLTKTPNYPDSIPVRTFRITMEVDRHEELFAQLRKFADEHSLEFGLSLFDADKISFLAAMYGDGFHITVVNDGVAPREIDVSFYNEASTPTPSKTIDELFSDLKSFLGEIPNVTISKEK